MLKRVVSFLLTICLYAQVDAKCKDRQSQGLLNEAVLIQDLATLSSPQMSGRKTGTNGGIKAKRFIQARFRNIGLQSFPEFADFIQPFPFPRNSPDKQGFNIVGWLQGKRYQQRFIVITAHYDHLGKKGRHIFYGADDNASGVAALLAVANKVSENATAYSVIFLATDAEEKGLHGAKAFIQDLPVNKNAIILNINLDMLGEGGRRNRLYATYSKGNKHLEALVESVSETAGLCLISGHRKSQRLSQFSKKINWRKASDHGAFSKADIPYLFVGGGVHNRYHTTEDNFENINQKFYVSAAETAWLIIQAADSYEPLN